MKISPFPIQSKAIIKELQINLWGHDQTNDCINTFCFKFKSRYKLDDDIVSIIDMSVTSEQYITIHNACVGRSWYLLLFV